MVILAPRPAPPSHHQSERETSLFDTFIPAKKMRHLDGAAPCAPGGRCPRVAEPVPIAGGQRIEGADRGHAFLLAGVTTRPRTKTPKGTGGRGGMAKRLTHAWTSIHRAWALRRVPRLRPRARTRPVPCRRFLSYDWHAAAHDHPGPACRALRATGVRSWQPSPHESAPPRRWRGTSCPLRTTP